MINEYEKSELEILQNASEHSSGDVWETFVNTSPKVLLTYIVNEIGMENTIDILKEIPSEN